MTETDETYEQYHTRTLNEGKVPLTPSKWKLEMAALDGKRARADARGPHGGELWRKKPSVTEVMQMTADNWDELETYANYLVRWDRQADKYYVYDHLHRTWIEFKVGDWIVTGPDEERYPVAGEMFLRTYEKLTAADLPKTPVMRNSNGIDRD